MRSFWLFRSDLIDLEYYHQYKDLQTFEKNCHDYYMLLPLWLLRNNFFDEVIVWRLTKKPIDDIIFDINGKKYIQKWVNNFNQTLSFPSPDISFWRGGFKKYDIITRQHPKHFGLKLYLGAGRRILPQWKGIYDIFLMEDERDFIKGKKCIPFYKTASPSIFHPLETEIKWDICWPCNFTQIKYKGQEEFIRAISYKPELKQYKIVHCGNKPEVGKSLCKRYGVDNIKFIGHVDRPRLNKILNQSKFGLNLSNLLDGCPRVSTEIMMSGTPLVIKDTVRLLDYFKQGGTIEINKASIVTRFEKAFKNYEAIKKQVLKYRENIFSFNEICKKNIEIWKKI